MGLCCATCGRESRETARFCDECGTRLLHRPVELRHGTVLFCDLVNSTRITNRLHIEDQRLVFRTFRDVVGRVARDYDGDINDFAGDGAFLSFGHSATCEDAEECAIRAGLALVAGLRSSAPLPGVALEVRVGIASGTVVVGDAASDAAINQGLVVGSVKSLAARLLDVAPPGGVIVAETTRRLAGRFFEYQDLGRLALDGFDDESVQAWLVLGATSIASRFEATRASLSPGDLLGRDAVLARLTAAWNEVSAGHGRVITVAGEAGIGKSRLARTMLDRARAEGARRLELDCSPRSSHTPLHPVSRLLRRLFERRNRGRGTAPERRLERMLVRLVGPAQAGAAARYLAPLIGVEPTERSQESPERIRELAIGALVDVLCAFAGRPTVVLFEDMHWADATTVFLMQRICERAASLPLLFLATTRGTPLDGHADLPGASLVVLHPLDAAAQEGVVRRIPGAEWLEQPVVDRIINRAEGNPLFLEELTRAVLEQPVQDGTPGGRHAADAHIPMSLQLVIAARLDRRPQLKPIVQAASILGREFPARLLAELLPDRRGELSEAVARLVDLGLLATRDGTSIEQLRFKHALIYESVYNTVLRSERQRLHSRAAEVLVRHFDGLPESAPDVLAHHLACANRFEEAVQSLLAAESVTSRRAAYLESVGHCRSGLALVDSVQDRESRNTSKLNLLTRLGVALAATSGYAAPEVEAVYGQARVLCAEGVAPAVLFPIVRGLGTFSFVRCDLSSAADFSASCLRLAQELQRPDFMIEALSFRGYTCLYRGELAASRAALQECLDLYRAAGGHNLQYPSPQDAGTAAWSLLAIAAWLMGDVQEAEAAAQGALLHSERLGRAFDTAYVHVWIAMLRNMQRRFRDAQHHAAQCIDISQRHGFTTWLLAATMHDCIAKAGEAAAPQSIATLRQMLNLFIQSGAEANASFFMWGIANGLRATGDVSAAAAVVSEALRRADATGESYFTSELLILGASLEADPELAVARLEQALDVADRQGAVTPGLRAALEIMSHRRTSTGNPERDRQVRLALDGIVPYPESYGSPIVALGAARAALPPPTATVRVSPARITS